MAIIKSPEFVFRGTTEGYRGGKNSIEMPYTCTSWHPVKALWFALECFRTNPDKACVYIARMINVEQFGVIKNHLHSIEDEIGFEAQPEVFYQLTDGLVYVPDFQYILEGFGFHPYEIVRLENLTWLCKKTPAITSVTIQAIVDSATTVWKEISNL